MRTPPSLLRALDYPGDAQFVALYQVGRVGKATDGVDTADAETYGWQLFRDHAMVQRLIAPYDLGDRGADAQHWLVVDSSTGKLAIMRPEDAAELLDTQPRTREALVGDLSPADRATYLDAVQQTTNAPSGTEAGWLRTWMDYARPIAAAQRDLVRDLNGQAGRSLLHRIHGLNALVQQTVSGLDDRERPGPVERPDSPLGPDRDTRPPMTAQTPDGLSADKPPDAAEGDPSLD